MTGVHLALSSNPQSYRTGARGCCTLEDARDARRAADVIGIPFYVWDLAERFKQDVVDDFVAEYAAGRTPNPCLRCNEKIKFEAVLDRALALGFDAVCTGHYARIDEASGTLQRAVDDGKDQSYVLAVLTRDQIAHAMFPLGDTPKTSGPGGGGRARPARRGQAGQPRRLLHRRRRHPRLPGPAARRRAGEIVDVDGTVLGTHEGAFGFTVGQRKGLRLDRPAPDGSPRYVLSIEPVSNTVTVGPADASRRTRDHRDPPGLDRLRAAACADRVHGPAPRPRRGPPVRTAWQDGDELEIRLRRPSPGRGGGPGGRPLRRRHGAGQRHHRRHALTVIASAGPCARRPARAAPVPPCARALPRSRRRVDSGRREKL